jgi:hypothetical protein
MAEFKLGRIRFIWKGAWANGITYVKDDIVRNGGKTYVCVVGHTSSADFTTDLSNIPTKWNQVSDGSTWTGDWTTGHYYRLNDIVKYGARLYICKTTHTSNASLGTGSQGLETTTGLEADQSKWDLYASSFDWKGTWATLTRYKVGDVVKYGSTSYVCNTGHTSAATATLGLEDNQNYWDVYAEGLKWLSTWTTSYRYKVNDVVSYGGQVYVCNLAHTSNASASSAVGGLEADQSKWDYFHKGIIYLGDWNAAGSIRYKVNDVVKYGADIWICTTYHVSTTSFITDESNWAKFVEGLQFENSWSNATTYQPGDLVTYGGFSYIAKTNHINKTPTSNASDWAVFTTGFNFRGDWSGSTVAYKVGDVVRNGGYTYLVIADHTSSGANQPPNNTYWSRLNFGIKWKPTAQTFTGLSGTNIVGSGTSAQFTVDTSGTSYTVTKTANGSGYAVGNTLKILGTSVGGTTPFNDVLITVTGISGGGGTGPISTFTSSGIASTWSSSIAYVAGDTVTYGPTSYICVLAHTSSSGNRPDADLTSTYWNVVAAGASTSILSTTGDIVYFGNAGPTRLGIGLAGQLLKVSTGLLPSWSYFGVIDQVYYVAASGSNTPAPDYGVTLDRPWLTVRYACEQIENGSQNSNAVNLLTRNRSYIQKEVIGWINYQVTNNLSPFTSSFTYNQTKCERDIGLVIDALAWDLSHGGNRKSRKAALAYVNALTGSNPTTTGTYSLLSAQSAQDVAGYNYMLTVINAVLANTAPGTSYQGTVTRVTDATKTLESGVTTILTNLVKIITDALTAQVSTNIPAEVITNYTIFVKTGIFYETLPIIVPENTAVVGDELRSTNIRPSPGTIPSTDTTYSIAAANQVKGIISNVIQNISVTPSSGNTVTQVTTRPAGNSTVGTAAVALLQNYVDYLNYYINSSGSAPTLSGSNTPTTTQAYFDSIAVLQENKDFFAAEAVAWADTTYSTTCTATATNGDITCASNANLTVGMPVVFTGTTVGTIVAGTTYYVHSTSGGTKFRVAAFSGGPALIWQAASGSFGVKLLYNATYCARDIRSLIDAVCYDLIYTGNYKTLLAARYYRRAVNNGVGSTTEDMFYVRNGTGVRNLTVQGLSGTLGSVNAYGTRRPSAGAYVSLDPGWGPNDSRVWITTRSCYVQNVTTFGTACVGCKIDGTLHNGGNRSIVSNDFTQVLSDGIGVWCTGANALTELVSVFSYYGHIGYLAENGGKIRATNGNSSYGTYGTVAEGVDSSEVPLTATINNRSYPALITNVVTDVVNKIYRFEYLNAGNNYNTVTYSVSGAGYGASVVANEFRDNGVFENRVLTTGTNYVSIANTGQTGNTIQFTIAATDQAIDNVYRGMRLLITSGTGAGQTGFVVDYAAGGKVAKIAKESFTTLTITGCTTGANTLTTASVATLYANMPIYLNGAVSNLSATSVYYVVGASLTGGTTFQVSTAPSGGAQSITATLTGLSVSLYAAGWDHVVPGWPISSTLDTTSSYIIEPRITFTAPTYTATARTQTSAAWVDCAYGDLNATYASQTGTVNAGSGTNAQFTVTKTGVAYSVALAAGGTLYTIGNTITIAGTSLGGTSTTNDLVITVTNVNAITGAVTNFTYSGTAAGGRYVAVASGVTTSQYSTNGTTWSAGGALPATSTWTSLAYGAPSGTSTWIAVANSTTNTAKSVDGGTTWTAGGALTVSGNWSAIAYGNGKFIAVMSGATTNNVSTNGSSWSAGGALPGSTNAWTGVAYGPGTWVAVASGGTVAAYSTNDGTTWTAATLPASATWSSVTFGNGRFVAVASGSTSAAYSLDGITWYASGAGLPVSQTWTKVRYGQGLFLATASGSTATAASSEDGINWTPRTLGSSASWIAVAFGNPSSVPLWVTLTPSTTVANSVVVGATARGRVKVSAGQTSEFRVIEPGSGYASAPTMTITDPNATVAFTWSVRIGVGVLGNPTFNSRGTQYATAAAIVSAGNGWADMYQTGNYINVTNLYSAPTPGSNVVITGNGIYYKLVAVNNLLTTGSGLTPYTATFQISPSLTASNAPAHGTATTLRLKYSQVRLTGHDFLNIGTGNITNTNYPGTPLLAVDATKQTVAYGGGRVFFTSTDQDGNFNVGDLFTVQQATGVATLNADAFNIAGLNQITLGAVTLGGTSATITSFSTDPYFTANSDNIVPTQKAIKSYITSQIGGGGGALNVNTLTAGVIYIAGNSISTTTNVQINVNTRMTFIGGVDGAPLALNFLLT